MVETGGGGAFPLGLFVGVSVGVSVGLEVGVSVPFAGVPLMVGTSVGVGVGIAVGTSVGVGLGTLGVLGKPLGNSRAHFGPLGSRMLLVLVRHVDVGSTFVLPALFRPYRPVEPPR